MKRHTHSLFFTKILICFVIASSWPHYAPAQVLKPVFNETSIVEEGTDGGSRQMFARGDMTGDGLPDVVIFHSLSSRQHRVLIVSSDATSPVYRSHTSGGEDLELPLFPGDVTGDGLEDLLYVTDDGRVRLLSSEINFDQLYQFSDTSDGRFVFLQPDQDGDGVTDVSMYDFNRTGNGVVNGGRFVLRSGADGSIITEIIGNTNERISYQANIGDVNDDNRDDFVFQTAQGLQYVHSGLDGSRLYQTTATLENINGGSVNVIGDLTGDGINDFLVLSRLAFSQRGAVLAVNGASGAEIYEVTPVNDTNQQFSLDGALLLDDIDGRGQSDIVVFSSEDEGRRGTIKAISSELGTILWEFVGEATLDRIGTLKAALQDVDGDGINDVLVGGLRVAFGGSLKGGVYAISGADGSQLYTVEGNTSSDTLGSSGLDKIGDLNSDGVDDFGIGSANVDATESVGGQEPKQDIGEYRVFSGLDGSTLFTTLGQFQADRLNGSILPGDMNSDGIPDVMVLSPNARISDGTVVVAGRTDGSPEVARSTDDQVVGLYILRSGRDGSVITSAEGVYTDMIAIDDLNSDGTTDFVQLIQEDGLVWKIRFLVSAESDFCPDDPSKDEAGVCGCGVPESDSDSDSDGTPDCIDSCPQDSDKADSVGLCGCGVADIDTDQDGSQNCLDVCPNDPNKTVSIGLCGCGISEIDSDSDGTPDCLDGCPLDSFKQSSGICGCGVPDADTDDNQIIDCLPLNTPLNSIREIFNDAKGRAKKISNRENIRKAITLRSSLQDLDTREAIGEGAEQAQKNARRLVRLLKRLRFLRKRATKSKLRKIRRRIRRVARQLDALLGAEG